MPFFVLTTLLLGLWVLPAQAQLPTTLSWNYLHKPPQHFLVERSLDGAAWETIAKLPGKRGRALQWHDTTLPPLQERTLVYYQIRAVRGEQTSPDSNSAHITVGPPAPGECITEQPEPKMTITVCSLK